MDVASVFEWFAQETANIAERANEFRRRDTLGKLALLWAATAAEQRDKQRASVQDEPAAMKLRSTISASGVCYSSSPPCASQSACG